MCSCCQPIAKGSSSVLGGASERSSGGHYNRDRSNRVRGRRNNGVLVPVGDSQALARAIAQLLADPALRQKMGNAARERTEREFVQDAIWETTIRNYQALLAAAARPTAIRGPRRARAAKAGT